MTRPCMAPPKTWGALTRHARGGDAQAQEESFPALMGAATSSSASGRTSDSNGGAQQRRCAAGPAIRNDFIANAGAGQRQRTFLDVVQEQQTHRAGELTTAGYDDTGAGAVVCASASSQSSCLQLCQAHPWAGPELCEVCCVKT